jgi:ubiquinone/menaquinone biosynthesis C-methylase UbiE
LSGVPKILWTGKTTLPKKLILNVNGIIAWVFGNMKDTEFMKHEIRAAYNGDRTTDVANYDTYGLDHYSKVADTLLDAVSVQGKYILDVGCGTGISTLKLLERQALKVCGVDISEYMVDVLKKKLESEGYLEDMADVLVADAENLPFEANHFDVVVSSMVFGMVPNPEIMMMEMLRVVKPGGIIALSTHGPKHYAELSDAVFKAVPKRYMLGRRILYWPRKREQMHMFFHKAGLREIEVKESIWHDSFQNGSEMYEFIASSTGNFYASFVPDTVMDPILHNIRKYFVDRKIHKITLDVVYAYGKKADI